MNVSSPCVKLCRLDSRGICSGCFRTLAEIACWNRMTEPERSRVMAVLDERREKTEPIHGGEMQ